MSVFPIRNNLKLHNISVTPKMVKKVIMNLALSRASGPDCTLVVVLTYCEPELAELFNNCLNKSCFPYCWKVSSVGPVFKNVGEKKSLQLRTTTLSVFLWFVKSLKNL